MARHSMILRYGVAVLSVAAALPLVGWLTQSGQGAGQLLLAAVMISAWNGGFGPGLLAAVLAVAALGWVLPPVYALDTAEANVLRVICFLLVALLISSLNDARTRLERELREEHRRKDDFLAMLAHELRGPLSGLLNAAHLLRSDVRDPCIVKRSGEIMEKQIRHMGRLINDLLDVSRIRQGKLELRREQVDLATVVMHAVETTRWLVEEKEQTLEVSLPAERPLLEADSTRLEQVVTNLLTNSIKFTEPDGHIWVAVERIGEDVFLRVRDDGIGIPPDLLPHVFDLHVQARNGSYGGLGIGLCLVRTLVQLHGGDVTAFSEGSGQGSEFLIRLPMQRHLFLAKMSRAG